MAEEERRVIVVWTLRDEYTRQLKGLVPVHKEAIEVTRRGIQQLDLYGRAARTTGDEVRNLSLGFRRLGGLLVSVSIMSFVANLIIRRLQHATLTLTEAEERYNKAVREHGLLSEQAITAERRLKLARKDLAIANREARLQMVLYSVQVVVLASRVLDVAKAFNVASLSQFSYTITSKASSVWDSIHAGILWVKAHAINVITLGLAAAAAATTWYIYKTQMATDQTRKLNTELTRLGGAGGTVGSSLRTPITFESSIIVEKGMDVEEAIDEQARRLKDEYRRGTS